MTVASSKTGDWGKVRGVFDQAANKVSDAAHKAVLQEAHFLRAKIVTGIKDQAPGGQEFKPLSPWTLAARRLAGFAGTKALIRTGDLRNSIAVIEKPDRVFIGVSRNATARDGKRMIDIADIQEFGRGPFVVRITDKMRKFLAILRKEAGLAGPTEAGHKEFLTITIPARPFIGPVFAKWGRPADVKRRIEERMAKMLAGIFAR